MSNSTTSAAGSGRRRMSAAARRAVIEEAATELFAEHGYRGASMDGIARRSGVSVPVLYDHFTSKRELYRELLESHFAELRGLWREHLAGDDPPRQHIARSFEAWFAYVEEHPFAGRVLFRDGAEDPEIATIHQRVAERSRDALMPLLAEETGAKQIVGTLADEDQEMVWVVLRGVLQGLAVWWSEHPEVPRQRLVATAMNALWTGFERVQWDEVWEPEVEQLSGRGRSGRTRC